MSTRAQDELGLTILVSIRKILRQVSTYSRRVGRDTGLGVPQLLCLTAIHEAPQSEVSVAYVADAVQLSRSTTSTIIDRLVRAGLVTRQRNQRDRRRVDLGLTDAGLQRIEARPVPLQEQFLTRLAALDASEQQQIVAVLDQLVRLMDAEDLDASPLLAPEAELR